MAKPIVVNVPPAPPKAAHGPTAAYNQFINKHPIMRPYADTISSWAHAWGVDKVIAASLFWRESFSVAAANHSDPETITSPSGAGVGIGQINPNHVGSATPWGQPLTESDLTDPAKNIEWSMWYFRQQLDKYGNPDDAYAKGYNPGYTGAPLSSLAPKGYVPEGGLSPTQKADVSTVDASAVKLAKQTAHISDPWITVVKDKNGRVTGLGEAVGPNPPKNVLTEGGVPLTKSEYTYSWASYSDIFQQFTGRLATPGEIAQTLSDGLSTYALKTKLSNLPGFKASPLYQQSGAEVTTYMRQSLGKTPPPALVAQALANNWSQGEIDAKLRALPDYESTPAFKQAAAPLQNVYTTIYGNPDATGKKWINNAALNGWSADQAAAALRADPAYKYSPEYQAKTVNFLDAMGLFVGARPTLTPQTVAAVAGSKLNPALPLQAHLSNMTLASQAGPPAPREQGTPPPTGSIGSAVLTGRVG